MDIEEEGDHRSKPFFGGASFPRFIGVVIRFDDWIEVKRYATKNKMLPAYSILIRVNWCSGISRGVKR